MLYQLSYARMKREKSLLRYSHALRCTLRPRKSIGWIKPRGGARRWWRMDSNHRRRSPADLQSAPFSHSGTPPDASAVAGRNFTKEAQSWRQDLNPQPVDYKSTALPVELRQRQTGTSEKSRNKVTNRSISCQGHLVQSCPFFSAFCTISE